MAVINKSIKGKICFVKDKDLGIKHTKTGKGHYVYVSDVDNDNGTCTVHTFTSLESKAVSYNKVYKRYSSNYIDEKISLIRGDIVVPLKYNPSDFNLWTGISKNGIDNVPLGSVNDNVNKSISKYNYSKIKKNTKK